MKKQRKERLLDSWAGPRLLGCLMLAGLLVAATVSAAETDTYTWNGELVSIDEADSTVTVKSRLVSKEALDDLEGLEAGQRIVLFWSGIDHYANGIRRVLDSTPDAEKKFHLPAEFVAAEPERQYVTFEVTVPAEGLQAIRALKPGEWITSTSRHGVVSAADAVVAVRPFVRSSQDEATS